METIEVFDVSEDTVIAETKIENSPDDSSAYTASQTSTEPEQVEEIAEQASSYSTSNELEDIMNESESIILDDLPIDSLVAKNTDSLTIEQAQELIPKEALKTLKEKFNGHLENCRPIQEYDRLI
ncbi:MAG: hypothetical protein O2827_00585 [Verrucomicrobia bacterium]|nr:hypothetical protein [Verrucomicrobiota bacterium]